jgi:hypothetical protein
MKTIFLLIVLGFSATLTYGQHPFSWLIGTWKLDDKAVYEVWTDQNDGVTLKGLSFKINNSDTIVLEQITFTKWKGSYYYIPDVAENKAPVKFKITSSNSTSFTAENSEHDFPKVIRYTIVRKANSESLEASIAGNGKVIPYVFSKVR